MDDVAKTHLFIQLNKETICPQSFSAFRQFASLLQTANNFSMGDRFCIRIVVNVLLQLTPHGCQPFKRTFQLKIKVTKNK